MIAKRETHPLGRKNQILTETMPILRQTLAFPRGTNRYARVFDSHAKKIN
jgi:hypothetical protein